MRALFVLALAVAGLLLAGCEKKEKETQAPEATAEPAVKAPEKKTPEAPAETAKAPVEGKQLTDELWVEIKANELAAMPSGEERNKLGPEGILKARDDVYKKFGVTKQDMDAFYNKLGKADPSKAAKMAMQASDQAEKLRQK